MRIALFVAATCALVAVTGPARTTAGPPPAVARSYYVVRPDPRLCPSPLCGGYWVSRANHARTRCHDGLLRPRCYAAVATDLGGQPLSGGLPAGLVKAGIGSREFSGLGELGAVAVAEVWSPVGREPPSGTFFRIRDTGIRCIRAPCFSLRVRRLNTAAHTSLVSALDLGPRGGSARKRAEAALGTPDGLFAAGRINQTADGGRLFRATQVYLKASRPHA